MPTARTYRSYEDFERDELLPFERPHVSVDDLFDNAYAQELDFDGGDGNGGGGVGGGAARQRGGGGGGRKRKATLAVVEPDGDE